ncbi:MAG TPA: ABC transporter permease [Thermohalobaculum sp.]|nr:ABC transporter permease [Thermohalobaculum sp.]
MIALEPRAQPSRALSLLSPVIAIGLTLVFGGLLLAAMGQDPLEALGVYFLSPFADAYSRAELVVKAIPLALMGAGLAVCFRANVWNIGAAGQYTLGAIFAGWLALALPEATSGVWLVPYLALGVLGGMAWAAIPALLRTRFNANEILVSLMLTYVAALLLDWLVRGPWRDPAGFGFPQSRDFASAFVMPLLSSGTRLHAGLILAVVVAILLWVMMGRTIRGFEVKVIGQAPRAGAFAGFSQTGTIWFVLLLSGGLSGLAGALEVSATIQQLQPEISAGYGFTAIIVAFLGRLDPVGALFGGVILAVSYIGGENAQILLKLPKNVTGIFQGMLLFFLLASDMLIRYRVGFGRRGVA